MMGQRSILAIELCMRLDANLQDQLRRLITTQVESLAFGQKWYLFDRARALLIQHKSLWVKGCWDFFDNDMRARSDFNMWVQGMLTEEGARPTPSGTGDPYRGDQRFMTFTMAALMVQNSPCERSVSQVCNIPEHQLWHGASFERVLDGVRYINFASVEASTMYLIPRDLSFGLTSSDLEHPKFNYLRPIV